jgi:hypothetical protein
MTEYRRMLLSGPDQGRWEYVQPEVAERLLSLHNAVGEVADQRSDSQQYWESSANGGAWRTHSYWPGAIDFWMRARLLAIERLANDERLIREKAHRVREGAGATIDGCKQAIAAAETALRQALADEKRDHADARALDKKADAIRAQITPIEREVARGAPETATV